MNNFTVWYFCKHCQDALAEYMDVECYTAEDAFMKVPTAMLHRCAKDEEPPENGVAVAYRVVGPL